MYVVMGRRIRARIRDRGRGRLTRNAAYYALVLGVTTWLVAPADGWARKHKVPVGFGTDLWGPDAQKSQLREFEMRQGLDPPADILRSATVTNAELLMEKGTLGIIAEGAYADLLIVEGNPLADLGTLMNPEKNLKFIMKDGTVYKNELSTGT